MRFGGGEHYFGDVEISQPPEGGMTLVLSPSLHPRGMEIYALGKPTSDDNEDFFPSSESEGQLSALFPFDVVGAMVTKEAMGGVAVIVGRIRGTPSCILPVGGGERD